MQRILLHWFLTEDVGSLGRHLVIYDSESSPINGGKTASQSLSDTDLGDVTFWQSFW